MSKTVSVADFAANVDAVLEEVAEKQEEVVLMRDGLAVARVVPIADEMRGPLYGSVRFEGDIVSPIEPWDVDHDRSEESDSTAAAPVSIVDERRRALEALRGSVTIHGDIVETDDEDR